jgi:TatD DNase family protein
LLFDVHAHLEFNEMYKTPIDDIMKQCKKNKMGKVVSAGIDLASNRFSLELSQKYPNLVLCGLGLHPETVAQDLSEAKKCYQFIKENIKNAKAISEIGLDGKYPSMSRQKEYFIDLIKQGIKNRLPLIIHTRKAEKEVIEIIEEHIKGKHPIILHCFSGKKSLIQRGIDNGWYFSIPPNVVRSQHFQMLVQLCPLRQLLTETDSPFLAPFSGEVNYPWNVSYSIKKIAEIKGLDEKEAENIIQMNFQAIF